MAGRMVACCPTGGVWSLPELVALAERDGDHEGAAYWRSALAGGRLYCTGCDRILEPDATA